MNPEIFRAYDIRGIYPNEINKETFFRIGQAFLTFLKNLNSKEDLKIVVGRDNRLSSKILARAFIEGVKDQGGDVIDIGLSTTPMQYFATWYLNGFGGAMITASHNPPEFNGIKLTQKDARPIAKGSGMEEIKNLALKGKFFSSKKRAKIIKKNILSSYLDFNFNFLTSKKLLPFKVVFDTANATTSVLIPYLQKKLKKMKFYHLFSELDGRFPNHPPDPLKKENLKFLIEKIKEIKADFGVAFDGDGDRIIFVDENGNPINGDLITALMAKIILKEKKGQKILYDIRSSRIVREVIEENQGKPYISKTGHSFIKLKMRRYDIFFGGELSGHYYLGANHYLETPLFVLFKIFEELSKEKKPFSFLIKPFKKYLSSGEINFEMKERKEVVKKLINYFKKQNCKLSTLDGVKAEFPDFWTLIRPSNTEPLLRLVIEAKNKKILKEKIKQMKNLILSFKKNHF